MYLNMIQNWLNMPSQLQGIESQSETRSSKGSNTLRIQVPYVVPYHILLFDKLELKCILNPIWTYVVKRIGKNPQKELPRVAFRSFFVQLWLFTQLSSGCANNAPWSSLTWRRESRQEHATRHPHRWQAWSHDPRPSTPAPSLLVSAKPPGWSHGCLEGCQHDHFKHSHLKVQETRWST